jgi:hypothetical protein
VAVALYASAKLGQIRLDSMPGVPKPNNVRIPAEVARESAMIWPGIPI